MEVRSVLWGGLVGLATALLLALIWALLIRLGGLPEGPALKVAYYSGFLSALVSGGAAARGAGMKGWLHGGLGGLFYGLLASALSLLILSAPLSLLPFLLHAALALLVGAVGGILGLNL